jgi:hypothetical protein
MARGLYLRTNAGVLGALPMTTALGGREHLRWPHRVMTATAMPAATVVSRALTLV